MFKKKGAPSAKSLDFPASDKWSGAAATNSKGQVIEQPQEVNWPYQVSTADNEVSPDGVQARPAPLSSNQAAYGAIAKKQSPSKTVLG